MKYIFMVVGIVVLGLSVAVAMWFRDYHANLIPELVLELPASECADIDFGDRGHWRWGSRVDGHCERAGLVLDRPVFAIRGKRAVRIVPDEFHYVYGTLETAPADEDTVYFYTYHPRYRPGTIQAP